MMVDHKEIVAKMDAGYGRAICEAYATHPAVLRAHTRYITMSMNCDGYVRPAQLQGLNPPYTAHHCYHQQDPNDLGSVGIRVTNNLIEETDKRIMTALTKDARPILGAHRMALTLETIREAKIALHNPTLSMENRVIAIVGIDGQRDLWKYAGYREAMPRTFEWNPNNQHAVTALVRDWENITWIWLPEFYGIDLTDTCIMYNEFQVRHVMSQDLNTQIMNIDECGFVDMSIDFRHSVTIDADAPIIKLRTLGGL